MKVTWTRAKNARRLVLLGLYGPGSSGTRIRIGRKGGLPRATPAVVFLERAIVMR